MSEIERILDNKPSRPPMISTLALRWQSMCPHSSGGGSLEEAGSPKSEGGNSQDQEQTKEVTSNKLPFCEIQWNRTRTGNRLTRSTLVPDIDRNLGGQGPTRMRLFASPLFIFRSRPGCGSSAHTTTSRHDNIYQLRRSLSPENSPPFGGGGGESVHPRGLPRTSRTDLYLSYVTLVDTRRHVGDKRDVSSRSLRW